MIFNSIENFFLKFLYHSYKYLKLRYFSRHSYITEAFWEGSAIIFLSYMFLKELSLFFQTDYFEKMIRMI